MLPGLPQGWGVVGGVLAVDAPALVILIEQCHGDAGDAPALGHAAQVFAEHVMQAAETAYAQLLAHQGGELVVLFALLDPCPVSQQVSDVQQVQGPAVALRLDPAAGMQDLAGGALEVQIQAVSLPLLRRALDTQRAVGTQQGLQGWVGHVGKMLGKQRPQGARDAQHPAQVVQLHLQARRGRRWRVQSQGAGKPAQACEQFIPCRQN